jgi:hypothetical protein
VLFQLYKHWHGQILDQATRRGCGKFDKLEFLAAIQAIRDLTFKKSSILADFRECRLFPRNPAIVIKKVKDYQHLSAPPSNRPSTPPSAEIWPPTTPLTT